MLFKHLIGFVLKRNIKKLWKDGKPDFHFKKITVGNNRDRPLLLTTSQYEIVGTMGSSHSCEIKVSFAPKDEKNLAPSIREIFVNRQALRKTK